MKRILWIPLLLAALVRAEGPADRAAIERVVAALNQRQTGPGSKPVSGLFTADAESELDRLASFGRLLPQASDRPWSEVTAPRLVIRSVRFVAPEVALVDAANTQYGSVLLVRRIPVLLVMKKEAGDWRIASLRVLESHLFCGLPGLVLP